MYPISRCHLAIDGGDYIGYAVQLTIQLSGVTHANEGVGKVGEALFYKISDDKPRCDAGNVQVQG